jgi:microsomal dipeptidase-like Zn-dependent dipeptidase
MHSSAAALGVALLGSLAGAPSVSASPALANGCFTLATPDGRSVSIASTDGYRAARKRPARLYLKPTGLGTYMLHDRGGSLLATGDGPAVNRAAAPGVTAEWAPRRAGRGAFRLKATENGRLLATDGGALVTSDKPGRRTRFRFRRARGCRRYPEAAVGARGSVFKGPLRNGRVFGYADAHLHVAADLRAGGQVISGRAFDRFGVTEALGRDAEVHGPDGSLDITGNLLRSGSPAGTHDTDGWPTFKGWPAFDTYTHQQVYYTWLKRSYMAGLRLVTAQLVEDEPLCEIEPTKSHSCDETETIALEAQRLRELQDYVDAQSGGPGRGWFRLVYGARQARRAIERGKLAVLMGVESSSPFGCSEYLGEPQCDRDDVDRGIALYRRLGIRSMFIAHWVDNAFGGAAFEEGDKGTFIATFQVQQTGRPFQSGPCPQPEQGETCNAKGLTELGEYLVNRLMDNHMLIEMDHLSEAARVRVLEIAEQRNYPLVSSHTNTGGLWTESDLRRLYAIGGFATARPDTAAKLAESILRFRRYRRRGQLLGVGIGTDTGGFAAMPEPDPAAGKRPLRYPFRSYDRKVSFVCQLAGKRKFDLNKDGVANYGLYADLLAYMRAQTGGRRASALLFRSAEAYLRTWRRAEKSQA